MVDFSGCIYWSEKAKIEYMQRRIIIYSLIYYKLCDSVVSDVEFDSQARQLVSMQKQVGRRWIKDNTRYGYAMYDFDATTGFHIASRLTWEDYSFLMGLAQYVLYLYEKENGGKRNGRK